jgi:hypothetical protein
MRAAGAPGDLPQVNPLPFHAIAIDSTGARASDRIWASRPSMKNDNLPGLSPLWLISLAMALGTLIVVLIPISVATSENIKSSDWIGFAGSVIAGAIALLAAILAWFAVRRQIAAGEDAEIRVAQRLAEQRETELANAKEAATVVLTHTVHAAAAVMNVTGQYLEALLAEPQPVGVGLQEYGGGQSKADIVIRPKLDKVMAQLKATMSHFAIAEAWKDLEINDRCNYLMITSTLHTVSTIYDNPPPILFFEMVHNQHGALSKLAVYLRNFDKELADVYDRDSKV